MNEFELIRQFCSYQTVNRSDVIVASGDDCAVLDIPSDQQLAVTVDTLVAGTHFPWNTSAFDIGFKALAVNLSDLAAMGATPTWVTFALTLPEISPPWIEEMAKGFFSLATRYNVQLVGGDLTKGALSLTLQAQGLVPKGKALTRNGAKSGDLIYVTHTLGDAGLGLQIALDKFDVNIQSQEYLLERLNRPEPRVDIGKSLIGIANSAIDISDGFAADLNHILEKSLVGAVVFVDRLPLSSVLRTSVAFEQCVELALHAGDDYELCFTIPKDKQKLLEQLPHTELLTCVGEITSQLGLSFQFTDGRQFHGSIDGYQHF